MKQRMRKIVLAVLAWAWATVTLRSRSKMKRATAMARWQTRVGLLSTAGVVAAFGFGFTDRLEWITLDWRAKEFVPADAAPSRDIAIVGIDDMATQTVARWPWPRSLLAAVIDELRIAGAKVVALDLLLDDPSGERVVVAAPDPNAPPKKIASGQPFYDTTVQRVEDDEVLAKAIKRHGSVIVAGRFKLTGTGEDVPEAALAMPIASSDLDRGRKLMVSDIYDEAAKILLERQGRAADRGENKSDAQQREENDIIVHLEGAKELIGERLLGDEYRVATRGGEIEIFKLRFDQAYILAKRGADSTVARPQTQHLTLFGEPIPFAMSVDPSPPVRVLGEAAARLGNVTFDSFDGDDKVRRVPLWLEYHGRLWPNLGLAAAMEFERTKVSSVTVGPDATIIELSPGRMVTIPTMQSEQKVGTFQGLHYVTWPRGAKPDEVTDLKGWEWQFFNEPLYKEQLAAQTRAAGQSGGAATEGAEVVTRSKYSTVSAGICYEPALQNQRIQENIAHLGEAAVTVLVPQGVLAGEEKDNWEYAIGQLATMDFREEQTLVEWEPFRAIVREVEAKARRQVSLLSTEDEALADEAAKDETKETFERLCASLPGRTILALEGDALGKARADFLNLRDAMRVLRVAVSQIDVGLKNIASVRKEIKLRLEGRIVFFGYIATGAIADFVTTSIDSKTPGVLLHAAVANAVLTGNAKHKWWVMWDLAIVALFGFLGTYIGVRSDVLSGPVVIVAVITGWYYFNGYVCWQTYGVIASVGGPAVAAVTAGAVVFLHRFLIESRDRRRVEDRFKSYVAPDVVDELVNNPELASMVPLQRDMTVMFTDVADFTTTSERLGPVRLAQFLDKYLGEMTKILQANRGTRDKYLGDGIMCFWNAPREDPDHARNACVTAVKMLMRVDELNEQGGFGDAGKILVRIGIATGSLMVGDFGNPPINSSYTVLGDTANLSSRLEGANKFFGSRILVNLRVKEAAGDGLRWRLIGKVNVKGKKEAEVLYELVGDLSPHGPATDEWIAMTDSAVKSYQAGNFDEASAAFEAMGRRFGDSHLAEIYQHSMELWKSRPDRETAFDGSIVLTEK